MDLVARYPDFWATRRTGQSYRPGRVVSGERAAWVLDQWLPVLVAIDPASNDPGHPIPLPWPPRGRVDITGLVAGEGRVWISWSDRIVRFEEHSRAAALIGAPGTFHVSRIAVGGGAAWALAGGGMFRIDPAADEAEPFVPGGVRRFDLGFGGGQLWTLEQIDPIEQRFRVARYAPENGELSGQAEVQGVQRMTANDAGVWLLALRWESPNFRGPMHRYVIRVNPASLDVVEHEISSEETFFPIGDEVWLGPHTRPSGPDEVGTHLRRTDLSTGESTALIEVPGLVTDLSVGQAGIWGLLTPPAGGPSRVARVDADAGEVVAVLDLADIDARPFLPAPPGPIDPAPVERKLRDELAGSLPNEHSSIPHVPRTVLESVTFEDVRLEGTFPNTEVVILFRTHYRPELRFGRRERIWSDDGVYVDNGAAVIWTNLEEDIIFEPSLPIDGHPDETGTIWM